MTHKEARGFVKKRFGETTTNNDACCASYGCFSASEAAVSIDHSEENLKNISEASNVGSGCRTPDARVKSSA